LDTPEHVDSENIKLKIGHRPLLYQLFSKLDQKWKCSIFYPRARRAGFTFYFVVVLVVVVLLLLVDRTVKLRLFSECNPTEHLLTYTESFSAKTETLSKNWEILSKNW
jgi:hypothetical protein